MPKPQVNEYWWVRVDNGEVEIARLDGLYHTVWYTCGDKQGWLMSRVEPLRRVRPFKA